MIRLLALLVAGAALAACSPVSQPKALNNGPLVLLPCLIWCTTSIVLDQADDNEGTVSTSVSESVSVGPAKGTPDMN